MTVGVPRDKSQLPNCHTAPDVVVYQWRGRQISLEITISRPRLSSHIPSKGKAIRPALTEHGALFICALIACHLVVAVTPKGGSKVIASLGVGPVDEAVDPETLAPRCLVCRVDVVLVTVIAVDSLVDDVGGRKETPDLIF